MNWLKRYIQRRIVANEIAVLRYRTEHQADLMAYLILVGDDQARAVALNYQMMKRDLAEMQSRKGGSK